MQVIHVMSGSLTNYSEVTGDILQGTAGSLQSLCWASAALGGVASAYYSGSLVQSWGPRGVFALTAAFPLVVSAAAVLIAEQPVGPTRLKADQAYLGALL